MPILGVQPFLLTCPLTIRLETIRPNTLRSKPIIDKIVGSYLFFSTWPIASITFRSQDIQKNTIGPISMDFSRKKQISSKNILI